MNRAEHVITRGWTKWDCACGEQFVTKQEADQHVPEGGPHLPTDRVRAEVTTWDLLRSGDLRLRDLLADWAVLVRCRVLGHRWEPQHEYYPGAGTHYEGDLCARCWRWNR